MNKIFSKFDLPKMEEQKARGAPPSSSIPPGSPPEPPPTILADADLRCRPPMPTSRPPMPTSDADLRPPTADRHAPIARPPPSPNEADANTSRASARRGRRTAMAHTPPHYAPPFGCSALCACAVRAGHPHPLARTQTRAERQRGEEVGWSRQYTHSTRTIHA